VLELGLLPPEENDDEQVDVTDGVSLFWLIICPSRKIKKHVSV